MNNTQALHVVALADEHARAVRASKTGMAGATRSALVEYLQTLVQGDTPRVYLSRDDAIEIMRLADLVADARSNSRVLDARPGNATNGEIMTAHADYADTRSTLVRHLQSLMAPRDQPQHPRHFALMAQADGRGAQWLPVGRFADVDKAWQAARKQPGTVALVIDEHDAAQWIGIFKANGIEG